MDPTAFHQYLQDLTTVNSQVPDDAPAAAAPAAPPHQSSWWQKILPAVGGVGGGILGTLLAGPIGGIAGATAGGALGQAGENATEGKQVLSGNDLTSGLENGVGQAVGLGIGKAAAGVGGAIVKGGQKLESKVATTVANDASTKAYAAIPKGLRQAHDYNGAMDLAGKLGVDTTNPANLVATGKTANSTLDSLVNDALGQSGPVNTDDYYDTIKAAIKSRNALGSLEPVVVSQGKFGLPNTPAAKLLQQLNGYGEGVIGPKSDPTAIRSLMQQVGHAYADAKPSVTAMTGAKDPVQVATHDALGEVYNKLKSTLYERPEVADKFKALQGNLQAADVGGSQQLADHLNGILTGAQDHQPVLDALQKFGNFRNVGEDALTAAKGLVTGGPDGVPTLGDGITNVGAGLVTAAGHPAGAVAAAAKQLHKAGLTPAIAKGVGKAIQRTAPLIPPVETALANGPNIAAAGSSVIPLQGTGDAMNPQNPTVPGQPQNPLDQLYATLLAQEQAAPTVLGPQLAGTLSTLAPAIQKNQLAADTVSNLAPSYANAGGAQGLGGGLLSRLTAMIPGTAANTYENQQKAAATQLAAALGITPDAAMAMLPSLMNNPNVAGQQQAGVGSILNTLTGAGAGI